MAVKERNGNYDSLSKKYSLLTQLSRINKKDRKWVNKNNQRYSG